MSHLLSGIFLMVNFRIVPKENNKDDGILNFNAWEDWWRCRWLIWVDCSGRISGRWMRNSAQDDLNIWLPNSAISAQEAAGGDVVMCWQFQFPFSSHFINLLIISAYYGNQPVLC